MRKLHLQTEGFTIMLDSFSGQKQNSILIILKIDISKTSS